MSSNPLGINPRRPRRVQPKCAREYRAPRPVTHEEASRVEAVTIYERFNWRLIEQALGRDYVEDLRARLGL